MTVETRKTLLLAGATLIIGAAIGALSMRIFAGHFHDGRGHHRGHRKEMKGPRHSALPDRIFSAVDADSIQRQMMTPIIEQIMTRHDSVGKGWHHNRRAQLDSLKVRLSPILREEQRKKLEELFSKKHKSSLKKVSHQAKLEAETDYWASL
jgi:hypothetical protein